MVAARADIEHLPAAGQTTNRHPNRIQSRVPSYGAQKLDICRGTCDDLVVDVSQRADTRGPGVVTRAPPPSGAVLTAYTAPTPAANFLTNQAGARSPQPVAPQALRRGSHPTIRAARPAKDVIPEFRATAGREFRSHRH